MSLFPEVAIFDCSRVKKENLQRHARKEENFVKNIKRHFSWRYVGPKCIYFVSKVLRTLVLVFSQGYILFESVQKRKNKFFNVLR